jgi:sec-independent protein translocase protein TatA
MGFSIPHLTVVFVIVILVFGTKHLKSLGSDLGSAINGFRKAVNDDEGTALSAANNKDFQDAADLGKKA